MESRKIQKVGAATFTISLPKDWITKRNLRKGDQLLLLEEGDGLRLLPGAGALGRRSADAEYLVDADLCERPGMLERVIVGNYVLGRERIVVRASVRLRSQHQEEVRRAIRRLMGIGIIEETSSRVVLQCSVNAGDYPVDALIKRLYNLGSTMLKESLEALVSRDVALAVDAAKREDDADMMYWLILRLVLSAQMDESLLKPLGLDSRIEIVGSRMMARDLETVADLAHDVAGYVQDLLRQDAKVPASLTRALQALAETIDVMYAKALGGLLSHDLGQANEALQLHDELPAREQEIVRIVLKEFRDPKVVLPLRGIYSSMLQMGEHASFIAVLAFNRYLERPTNLCRPAPAPSAPSPPAPK